MATFNPAYVPDSPQDFSTEQYENHFHRKRRNSPETGSTDHCTSMARVGTNPEKHIKRNQRDKWGKDIEFLLSCIALSVGLGNVWRFPFTALENGGGAFVIPYLIVLLLVGRPIYYLEMLIGQFSSRGCIEVYDAAPAMRGIGYGQTYSTFIVMTYYASLMGLTTRYLIASFGNPLPWSKCKPDWNATCVDSRMAVSFAENITATKVSSAELFFVNDVLKEVTSIDNGIGSPDWKLVLCLLFPWICICLTLMRGIKSSGKAAYFLAIFPYVVMILLLIRACTLEGAGTGMLYFIKPQWDRIFEAKVWYSAVTQMFFSLTVCFGNVIMYSSYNRFSNNVYRDVTVVTILDTATSMLSGLIVFGVIGHLAHVMGVDDIRSVVRGGAGLAFITYPDAIAKFRFWPQFFAVAFFLMLFVLGIGSNVGMATTIMAVIRDRFPQLKPSLVAFVIAIAGFGIGTIYTTPGGQFLLDFLDFYGASFVALVLAVFEIITFSWIYGVARICRDIEFMLGIKTGLYWRICWAFITPVMLAAILIYHMATYTAFTFHGYVFTDGMYAFGWCVFAAGVLQLPAWAVYTLMKRKEPRWRDQLTNCFKPTSDWGPEDPELNIKYHEMEHKYQQTLPVQRSIFRKAIDNVFH
ncbi:sodium-dependent nutrient amino acid transporter 1-like [Topomyia yanbarensis]|uniref:sodium-dependent nutrient amino acid transporter 1-like n=1 Tax=Topomyia yanbarensis TaxID=2498891 RepID=UPI00273C3AA3|nr:sodium-dependent nutrient amino acid transporter 1-like [Topomyia yanbarensis]XP_058828160.1 sodium-dependent nutrient amino acid transporter 1-like [Topomyia yanbarensis]XP_058828161.1 sodium-dependent nutrient amino acid transporter 1-like [Topomyia yanbarensis]XP_058828162.1 sodium-dependent nutrient amino acid transporter 1-like [Topomyia yanbarensis]XP_058828163.1 sodium-dependent nutrient amino acid transporter 1-like [Topomyia yanbarensis]XP_058828164.1 sodium-dependent nutrient amin